MRGKRIDQETKAAITAAYLSDDGATYAAVAAQFGISAAVASRIIQDELRAGAGIVPDRRQSEQPEWMGHVTPLHKHKMALEQAVEHKQAELDAAKQELRDFMATLRQLMEENA